MKDQKYSIRNSLVKFNRLFLAEYSTKKAADKIELPYFHFFVSLPEFYSSSEEEGKDTLENIKSARRVLLECSSKSEKREKFWRILLKERELSFSRSLKLQEFLELAKIREETRKEGVKVEKEREESLATTEMANRYHSESHANLKIVALSNRSTLSALLVRSVPLGLSTHSIISKDSLNSKEEIANNCECFSLFERKVSRSTVLFNRHSTQYPLEKGKDNNNENANQIQNQSKSEEEKKIGHGKKEKVTFEKKKLYENFNHQNDQNQEYLKDIQFEKSPILDAPSQSYIWDCGQSPNTVFCSLSPSGLFSISGNGLMKDYTFQTSSSSREWYGNRSKIISIITNGTVSSIGSYAFYDCDNLTTLNFGPSLAILNKYCFRDCDGLINLTFSLFIALISDYAFYQCRKLERMRIPSSVGTIGSYTFAYCTSLAELIIEDGVQNINSYAFQECSKLGSVTIPGSIITIGIQAFSSCASLAELIIEDGVQNINKYAFNKCTMLTSVTIPQSVTSIGYAPFVSCSNLTTIKVDERNEKYESRDGVLIDKTNHILMEYPGGISGSYQIPSDIKTIQQESFSECSMLTSVSIPGSVSSIGNSAFYYCTSLSLLTLQYGIQTINTQAFRDCSMLPSVLIPGSVTTVGSDAFWSCTRLFNLTLQHGIKTLDSYAFEECSMLTSVIIPSSVTKINGAVFYNCKALNNVTYCGESDPGPSSYDVFSGCLDSPIVYVPSLYKNTSFCKHNNIQLGNLTSCSIPISNTHSFSPSFHSLISSLFLSNSFPFFCKIATPLFLFFEI